jgi:hypothetical protein
MAYGFSAGVELPLVVPGVAGVDAAGAVAPLSASGDDAGG